MGGYDVYCAICGGPFGNHIYEEVPDVYEEWEIYDRDIVTPAKGAWLDQARVMGEDQNSEAISKVFVSGDARGDDCGFFDLRGDDEQYLPDGMTTLQTYNRDSDHPLAVPFHAACYGLLQAKIGSKAFRNDVLYHTFGSYLQGEYQSVLGLDWGAIGETQEQYFCSRKGDEEYVLCPTDIPRLQEYYAALPHIQIPARTVEQSEEVTSVDIFAALPAELLLLLLEHLPLRDMLALRQASAGIRALNLTNSFWKGRLLRDMPWLYDIPNHVLADDSVDWHVVYQRLYFAGQRGHENSILALINRRRIWETMDQIMYTYFTEWFRVQSNAVPILDGAQMGHIPLLIEPEPTDVQRSQALLLRDFHEVTRVQPRVTVYWTDESVVGLSISHESSEDVIGRSSSTAHSKAFTLPLDDWVKEVTLASTGTPASKTNPSGQERPCEERRFTGIKIFFAGREPIAFGAMEGDQRVLRPSPGHIIVGLMGDCSSAGQVFKLAILEQARDKFPMDCTRITHATGQERHTAAEKLLWRTEMRGPRTMLSDFEKGYWGYSTKPELLAMEQLVFAETDAESASITRISGDMHMGGFKIEYADREPRSIGPRFNTMKSISIDGAGGERVSCIVSCVEHIVKGIRFITNRGKALAIGLEGSNRIAKRYSASQLDGRELVGIYCSWLERSLPSSRLETFGVLSRDYGTYRATASPTEAVDERNYIWEPTALPAALTGTGRLWGEWSYASPRGMQHQITTFPADGSVVSWLDFSRQIAEVEVLSCHAEHQHRLNVVGVAFQYADGDGERIAVGYTELLSEGKSTAEDFRNWCQCNRGALTAPFPDDGPHIWSTKWKPGQEHIKALRIYMDKHGALSGMQFVDGAGEDSALFGFQSVEGTSGEIGFGGDGGEEKIVGVKFFMNHNNRHVTYDDVVVVALQAVVKA